MLADFTITIHTDPERSVRVVVHPTVRALRAAATRMDRVYGVEYNTGDDKPVGLCHRFEGRGDDLVALVRLAPPHIGVGVLSHELAHAAVWVHELNSGGKPLVPENDEFFCWVLGELVSKTVTKLYEHEVY